MTYLVRRLNHVASTTTSNVDKKSFEDEITVRLCNYTDVYKNNAITTDMDFMVATATRAQISKFGLKTGDTVFTKDSETSNDIGIPAYVAESAPDLVCGYHLAIARPFDDEINPRFLYWCLASPEAAQQWSVLASGVTRVGLRQPDIGKLEIPVPPLQTQRTIAAFLDRETVQIDDLIGEQERLIELLTEKRQAVITHAVTKGLDPTVATKPSGIPWLGEIPAHWRLTRLAEVTESIVDCLHTTPEAFSDGDYWVVRTSSVRNGRLDLSASFRTDYDTYLRRIKRLDITAGDLLLTREAPAGEACMVGEERNLCLGQRMVQLRTRAEAALPQILLWNIYSDHVRTYFDLETSGSMVQNLTMGRIGRIPIVVPPMAEQQEITKHVSSALRSIDDSTARAQQLASLLFERRSALISAAVTGKVNVGSI